MKSAFNVGDTVYVKATIAIVHCDKDGIKYSINIQPTYLNDNGRGESEEAFHSFRYPYNDPVNITTIVKEGNVVSDHFIYFEEDDLK